MIFRKEIPHWMKMCPECSGDGDNPDNPDEDCPTCKGKGIIEKGYTNPIDMAWSVLKEEGYVDEHGYNEHGFDEHGDMDLDSGYSVRVSGDDSWDSFFDSKESMLEWLSDILDKPGTFEYTISPPPEPPEPKVWIDEGDEQ